ncbi:MAG: hypothetical protein RIC35_02875 [Marinoscillum sp.]
MKKTLITLALAIISFSTFAQLGIAFHQSNIPQIGVNYQIGERFIPEFRVGVDVDLESTPLELVANYMFVKKEDYQFYAGIGGRVQAFEGVVIPVGLNVYPFTNKSFGFHTELAPVLRENSILRGSWGIRYIFK